MWLLFLFCFVLFCFFRFRFLLLGKVFFTFLSDSSFLFFSCAHRFCSIFSPYFVFCCTNRLLLNLKYTLHFCSKLMIFLFCRYYTVHGGWSSWSRWTSCTQSCGSGSQERSRTCTSPPPRYGGNYCLGNPREKQLCNKLSCPGKKRIVSPPLSLLCPLF